MPDGASDLQFTQLNLAGGPSLLNKSLFRPDEVTRFFRISRSTVYRWCDEEILLACNSAPGTVRIFRSSILDAIKKSIR
jgi:hypothetical protein